MSTRRDILRTAGITALAASLPGIVHAWTDRTDYQSPRTKTAPPSGYNSPTSETKASETRPTLEEYIKQNKERWLVGDYEPFLRMDCTSTKVGEDLAQKTICASYLEQLLLRKGFTPRVFIGKDTPQKEMLSNPVETGLDSIRPVVYFEIITDPSLSTSLLGTHYDRRPKNDNLDDPWKTPWLEPVRKEVTEEFGGREIKDTRIYVRGADDSVGHIMSIIWALEAYQKVSGSLPVNVKVMFEGAEEIGSPGMDTFIEKYKKLLKADLVIVEDAPTTRSGIPAIYTRLRGTLDGEICVKTSEAEGHSGGGSFIPNAEGVLAKVMGRIEDPLTKEVFLQAYKQFKEPTLEEKEYVKSIRPDLSREEVKDKYGLMKILGSGHPAVTTILYPSWDWQATPQENKEGIIPSRACKVFMARLVPGQNPQKIFSELEEKIKHFPEAKYAQISVTYISGSPAVAASLGQKSHYYLTLEKTLKQAFAATELDLVWDGAGEPIYSFFQKNGFPVALIALGNDKDNPHGTNESMLVNYGLLLGVRWNFLMISSFGKGEIK